MSAQAAPDAVRMDVEGAVAHLIFAAPAQRNPLSSGTIARLRAELAAIAGDASIHAVVVSAQGPVFCAGHDLKELTAHRADADGGRAFHAGVMRDCSALMQEIVASPKPIIAAVEGMATAAGCQLVAACDLAICGARARFALPGVNLGLFCSTPLVAVGRVVSRKHAMEMALSGAAYDAAAAERFGLVNRVVPEGEAVKTALDLAHGLAARSPTAVAMGKRAFYAQIDQPLSEAYVVAAQAMVDGLAHADSAEGIAAFLEKRSPHWGPA